MRKVPLLLGLAILLAAGALVLFLSMRSGPGAGSGPGAASPAALRPGAAPDAARPDLAQARGGDAAEREEAARVEAKQKPKVKLGAETARALGARAESGPRLTGRVVGLYGVGVEGARVELRAIGAGSDGLLQVLAGTTKQEVVTGANGEFVSPLFERWEELQVDVEARGYAAYSEPHDLVEKDGDQDLGVIELEPAVVLGGRVVDADGAPLEGAKVRRIAEQSRAWRGWGEPEGEATDADGRFELAHEEPGAYTLQVEAEGHPTGTFYGTTPQGGGEDLSLVLRMPRGATIAGRIDGFPAGREYVRVGARPVEPGGRAGIEDAFEVFGFGASGNLADVGPDGAFALRGLEAGKRYDVRAFTVEGFGDQSPRTDSRDAVAGDQDLRLTWNPGATLRFRALDARTSNPLDELEVRYRFETEGRDGFPGTTRKRTFRGGAVELVELYPKAGSTLAIQVSAPGYLDLRREKIAVAAKGEVDLGTLKLEPAPEVRVVVVDAQGDPVRGARVRLEPEVEDQDGDDDPTGWFSLRMRVSSGRTGDDGACVLAAPATPTARLAATHPRYASTVRAGVPMPAAGQREEIVRLGLGGEVAVVVVDDAGRPVRDVTVEHRYPPELELDEADHETNRRGEVRLSNQPAGLHRFRVAPSDIGPDAPDGEDSWTDLRVADEAAVDLVLRVSSRGSLAGRVTEAGKPLARANVMLAQPEDAGDEEVEVRVTFGASFGEMVENGSDRTDRSGAYELKDIPAGRYRLRVAHADRAAEHVVPVEIRPGANRLDVDLPLTAIEGRVTDAAGAPLRGARVHVVPAPKEEDAETANARELGRGALRALFQGAEGARTDADGAYRLVGVIEDVPLCVEATAEGYVAGRSEPVTVALGRVESGVVVRLERGSTLRVRLEGAGAFSFAQATWDGDEKDAPKPEIAMFKDGVATIDGLKPGPWRVRRAYGGGDEEGVRVIVPAQGEATVDLAP